LLLLLIAAAAMLRAGNSTERNISGFTLYLQHACIVLAAFCVQRQQHRLAWLPWYLAMVTLLCAALPGDCWKMRYGQISVYNNNKT
jgi:hypothetical protein